MELGPLGDCWAWHVEKQNSQYKATHRHITCTVIMTVAAHRLHTDTLHTRGCALGRVELPASALTVYCHTNQPMSPWSSQMNTNTNTPVKLGEGCAKISQSIFRAIIYAPAACLRFPMCCCFETRALQRRLVFRGRKSRTNFTQSTTFFHLTRLDNCCSTLTEFSADRGADS